MRVAASAPDDVSESSEVKQLASGNRPRSAGREERASAAIAVPPLVPDGDRSRLPAEYQAVAPDAPNKRCKEQRDWEEEEDGQKPGPERVTLLLDSGDR